MTFLITIRKSSTKSSKTPALCKRTVPKAWRTNKGHRSVSSVTTTTASPVASSSTAAAIARTTAGIGAATRGVRVIVFFVVTHRRGASLEFDAQLLAVLAHIGVSHVHLPEEVICQAAVVVKARQVSAADIANLQLLVT